MSTPPEPPPADHVPSARIPVLKPVAWRDSPAGPWRYGSTSESRRPPDGPEVVVVYEYDPPGYVTFVGDEIDLLVPKPLPTGSGGRSTKRIG